VISKLLLPEDLMIYIFTLVPLTCLVDSAKYVCKSWAATIRSSHFVEAIERQGRSKPGLYVVNHLSQNTYFLEFKDDVNCQFERIDLGTPPRMGHVIGTCDGILLLLTNDRQTFVVNPILKCWLKLNIPPFPLSVQYKVFDYSRNIARVPRTGKFKLFYVYVVEVNSDVFWYVWCVIRIGIDKSWKEIARKEYSCNMYNDLYLLYSGGNDLYWVTEKEVIVMDVDREIILREYPLHLFSTVSTYYLLLMGDRISCIVYKDVSYEIYVLDFDSGKWFPYYEMGPFDYAAACGHELDIKSAVFRLWINDQIIFRVSLHPIDYILANLKTIHFGYNVKTKQLTKIEGIGMGNFEVWLHTNSLVSFPSTST
jgi:hypothetical protein